MTENKNPTKTKKHDFVEIEFTAKVKDTGEIFDTNIKADAEKANFKLDNIKPFILSIGNKMILPGFDKDLEGKQIGKKYSVSIEPEQAFGKRNPQQIKMIPLRAFTEQKINPQPGMQLSLDNQIVRILSVSGGRILVDFNNPLAGKQVVYDYKINKKITTQEQKINALQDFLFRQRFEYTTKKQDKNTNITFKVPEQLEPLIKAMSKPFQEILKVDISTETIKPEKPEEKQGK